MSVAPDTDLAAVVRADLNRSGQFRTLADADMVEKPIRAPEINFATWRLLKQDFILIGRVLDTPDGGYRTEFERSEEHTSELQSLMRISYAAFCLKKQQKC